MIITISPDFVLEITYSVLIPDKLILIIRQYSIVYKTVKLYNDIPVDVRHKPTYPKFKNIIRKFLPVWSFIFLLLDVVAIVLHRCVNCFQSIIYFSNCPLSLILPVLGFWLINFELRCRYVLFHIKFIIYHLVFIKCSIPTY